MLRERPPWVEMVLTGRQAPPELVEMADLVTEMRPAETLLRGRSAGPARHRVVGGLDHPGNWGDAVARRRVAPGVRLPHYSDG